MQNTSSLVAAIRALRPKVEASIVEMNEQRAVPLALVDEVRRLGLVPAALAQGAWRG